MRALVQVNQQGFRMALSLVLATMMGACAQLKPSSTLLPPTQATPEQAAERDRESPTPKVVQTRHSGNTPQQCLVTFDDEGALVRQAIDDPSPPNERPEENVELQ